MYSRTSSRLCLREKESGSSPSGSSTTWTFIPSASTIGMPRRAAWMPAESPSYMMVMFSVNFLIRRTCSTVSEVPQEATTLVMPSWCIITTSTLPSTRMQRSSRAMSLFAK